MNPFQYAMASRQMQKDREEEIHSRSIEASRSRVLNANTDNTGLFGANKSPFKTSLTQDINNIMNRNSKITQASRKVNDNLRHMNNTAIDKIIKT